MNRTDQPSETHIRHQVLDGRVSLSDRGLVVEGHREPCRELNQETHKCDSTEAVKNVDVWRHVLAADVISNVLNFKTFLEPVVDR